ncbi:helix-turn-helix transcriptional regulator [Leuconostoc carnosum]|nr:helix-turn-helix transcriptional regulator [Leuconostoc carnosum]KAA8327169.1 helix-turn-helix transcriptional regulator [Leuconostoc carnosum]QEA33592.1 helix-turn-helix transcriptional regulator [Leuconostoc carnosum]
MSFEQDIKKLRMGQGMTQQELADQVHVSRQTVSTWETGKNYPSLDVLRSLSLLFDISFEKIMFGEEIDMKDKRISVAESIDKDVSLKQRYKKVAIIFGSMLLLLIAWVVTLTIGYQKGINTIDRLNPFLQYQVAYTKMPDDKEINPNNQKNHGYWTRWFSDNEMGTDWHKLTLTTGINPGVKNPYVMAYHKGSYVKIARIVPGSSVSQVMKSNVSAVNRLVYSKNKENLSLNMGPTKTLKHKIHYSRAIQELVVE